MFDAGFSGRPAVGVGGQLVGLAPPSRFEDQPVGVQHVVAVAPREEDVQVEILPVEVVAEAARVEGLSAADDRAVVVVDDAVAVHVAVFHVARLHRVALERGNAADEVALVVEILGLVGPVVDEAVHHARGLAHLRDVGELRVEARLPRYGTLERVLSVDQPENPVAVEGDVERRGPLELTGLDVHRFERQLEARGCGSCRC